MGTKNILLLGGTGAMGVYMQSVLLEDPDARIFVTSRVKHTQKLSDRIEFLVGNARKQPFLEDVLSQQHWDAVVDFMIRPTKDFQAFRDTLLNSTDQYIYLSSYRAFNESPVIVEDSPRLLDSIDDEEYLQTDEYALAKARQENLLKESGQTNWTVVRPAITYSKSRFQLCTLEADEWLWRAMRGHKVVLPQEMMEKQATMSWAGDVSRMIALLIGNEKAFGEAFNVTTAEHHSWSEIAKIYQEIIDFDIKLVPVSKYLEVTGRPYQIKYDRMFNRVMDNTKILETTGMKADNLKTLKAGLELELPKFIKAGGTVHTPEDYQGRSDKAAGGFFWPSAFEGEGKAQKDRWKKYFKNKL